LRQDQGVRWAIKKPTARNTNKKGKKKGYPRYGCKEKPIGKVN